jgi:phenylacetate-CoA ligase
MGYCSTWFLFCGYLESAGERLPLDAVYATAEVLHETWGERIKQVTGARVVDYYGCGEINSLGHRIIPGGPHWIAEDHVVIEVLDEKNHVSPEGPGEFVITDLGNRALPLLRYRNGDAGLIGPPDKSSGLPFRCIRCLDGRVTDLLYRTDGSRISGPLAPHVVKQAGLKIDQYQLCQERIGAVTFRHTPSPYLTPDKKRFITRIIRLALGEDTEVSFEETTDLPVTASGKRRFAICRVNKPCDLIPKG